jgi:hypothetical protein
LEWGGGVGGPPTHHRGCGRSTVGWGLLVVVATTSGKQRRGSAIPFDFGHTRVASVVDRMCHAGRDRVASAAGREH